MSRPRAPTTLAMTSWRLVLGALMLGCIPGMSGAQVRDRDARIPRGGEFWLEFAPEVVSWNRQYALDSPVVEDGQREPVFVNYDGRITDRLYPSVDPLLLLVNRDADALGFDPVTAEDASMGVLDFKTIDFEVRRLPLALQVGIGGFAAIEVLAPLVKTDIETSFVFDSAAANLVAAETALDDPSAFLAELAAAQYQLQTLLDGGFLSPEDAAIAEQLLADSEAFHGALGARVTGKEYLFTASSPAGGQMISYYDGLAADYASFGISTPAFGLPASVGASELDTYFTRDPVSGQPIGSATRGWDIGEIEIGVRFKLLDTFGWPRRPPQPPPSAAEDTSAGAAPEPEPAEAPAGVEPGELPAAAEPGELPAGAEPPEQPLDDDRGGIRFRTTVGARYRFPLSEADREPYLAPDQFLQQPIGDGQPDVQLELYQDIGLGRRFLLVAGATYGIQLQDELVRRISLAGAPYAYGSQQVTMQRDLGDYLQIFVSPRFALAEALSLAVEYSYWDKKEDVYEVSDGSLDATALTVESSERRHMLGIGAYYRTTRLFAAGRSSVPIDLAFVWETAIGGSGGRTPVPTAATASARVPFRLF